MSKPTISQVYFNRRMAALLMLGFACGLPSMYRLLGSTLQAWLSDLDVDVTTLGLVTLVALPFTFNFAWAPMLDRYLPPGPLARLGRRRGWLVAIQSALVAAIACMAAVGPTEAGQSIQPLIIAAVVVAWLAASQDVVGDAYRTDVLPREELGAGAAVFVNGYRIAMLTAGGGALYLSEYLPWRTVYLLLAGVMSIGIVGSLIAPSPTSQARPQSLAEAVVLPAVDFFRRRGWSSLAVLLFIVLFKLPDAMAGPMTMPLLLDLEFGGEVIAVWREWGGLGAMVVGALVGGGVAARIGLAPALWVFGILGAVSNAGFMCLAWVGRSVPTLAAVVMVESFCAGLVTAGFIAFLMAQCNRRYSATQYALFTSVMAATSVVAGSLTGYVVEHVGYTTFFAITIAAGAPGLLLLAVMGKVVVRADAANDEVRMTNDEIPNDE